MSKIKGITIWEQYVEYLVLGVAVVAALALTVMQFVGQPNAVERPGHGRVAPGQVDSQLVAEANRINQRLSGPAERIPDPEPLLPVFDRGLQASVSPAPRIEHKLFAYSPLRVGEWSRPEVVYHVPKPPAPKEVVAAQHHDTLTEEAVEEFGLHDLFPTKPHDITSVSVAGVLPMDAIKEELRKGNAEGNPASIPAAWLLSDRPTVVNIVMERQTYIDGQPSEIVQIDVIPGQFHVRDRLEGEVESSRRDEIIRLVRDEDAQNRLLQPPFYPTKSGSWSPPDPYLQPDSDEPEEVRELRRAMRELRNAEETRERLARTIERLEREGGGGGGTRPGGGGMAPGGGAHFNPGGGFGPGGGGLGPGGLSPGGGFWAGGGGGGGGGEAGGGGGGAQPGPGGRGGAGDPQRLEALRKQLADTERRIEDLRRRVERLSLPGITLPTAPEGEVIFWAHDLTVEAGQTYRYRFIVEIYNPFCARKLNLLEEQHHLAESYVIATEPSEWSAPILIDPPVQMFVTEAHPPRAQRVPGPGRPIGGAKIEIYRFYDGTWRQRDITIESGDRVAATGPDRRRDDPVGIDFVTDWYILDVIPDPDASDRDTRAARVIFQNVRTGEIIERHPEWDARAREELRSRASRLAGRM